MGGTGAKERRKLQRQTGPAKPAMNDSSPSPEKRRRRRGRAKEEEPQQQHQRQTSTLSRAGFVSRKDSSRSPPKHSQQQRDNSRSPTKRSNSNSSNLKHNKNNGNNNNRSSTLRNVKPATPKKKSKKPKHLKRKLEAFVDDNGDSEEKARLLQQMQELERRKKQGTEQGQVNSKKHKRNISTAQEENQVTKVETTTTSFPRSDEVTSFPRTSNAGTEMIVTGTEKASEQTDSSSDDSSSSSSIESGGDENKEDAKDTEKQKKQQGGSTSLTPVVKKNNISGRNKPSKDADSSSSNDDNDVDDSDNDDDEEDDRQQRRQRGKRRRGRQDTSEKAIKEAKSETANEKQPDLPEKKRYCKGRKPLTDFTIGKSYSGTVVYVKPFGVFFDIGCHADAFCHVSRLNDEFVESPETLFQPGKEVTNIRILEIDRRKKRITASLQSQAMHEQEQASIMARKDRNEKRGSKKPKAKSTSTPNDTEKQKVGSSNARKEGIASNVDKPEKPRFTPVPEPDPSSMTPAELKRARKLARRAGRRAELDQTATE